MVTVNGYTLLWEDEATDDTFDLVNYRWSKTTGGTNYIEPSVNANGSLNIGRGYVLNLKMNTLTPFILTDNFKVELDLEQVECNFIVGVGSGGSDGGFVEMECYTDGRQAIKERRGSDYITLQTTNINDNKFSTTEKPRNTLIIKRLNGVISFEWVDINGSAYSFTSTNVTSTAVMTLRFRGFDSGYLNIHRLSLWQKDIVPTRTHNPNYTTLSSENNEDGFDLTKWSQHIPTENADGSIRPIYGNNYYNITFPNDADWKLELVFKIGGHSASFTYSDSTYGDMVFSPRTTGSVLQKFEWVDGVRTKISETSHNPIYVDENGYSTLALIGRGKDVMWKYTNANGDIVSLNRTYTNFDSNRKFYIYDYQSEGNYVDIYSITFSKMSSLIGTGTGTVQNGRAEGILTIQQGKELTGGYSYTIFADYPENSNYEHGVAVGTLEVLKKDTYTTITGATTVRNGELLVLNISVTDKNGNPITSGTVNVYDGNEVVQSSHVITGQTTGINFVPMTAGVHNLRAVYTPSDNQYNSSNSNVLSVSAVKGVSEISLDDGSVRVLRGFGQYLLTGNLSCNGEAMADKTINVYDFSNQLIGTVTTDTYGDFSYYYEASISSPRDDELTFEYAGDDFYESVEEEIDIHVAYTELPPITGIEYSNHQNAPSTSGYYFIMSDTNFDWFYGEDNPRKLKYHGVTWYNPVEDATVTTNFLPDGVWENEYDYYVYMIDSDFPENSFAIKFLLGANHTVDVKEIYYGLQSLLKLLEWAVEDNVFADPTEIVNQISLLYQRSVEDDTNFSLANYSGTSNDNMSSATTVNRFIDNNGYLDCGVNVNTHHSLPSGDEWIIEVEAKMSGDSAIVYNNTVDGGITFKTTSNGIWKTYDNELYTFNTSSDTGSTFNDNNHEYNTLTITRHQNKITFSYIDTNDEKHTFTKTYNSLSENGTLYFRVADGSLKIKSLTFITTGNGGGNKSGTVSRVSTIDLPILESSNWTFISRGEGSSEPVMETDKLTLGKYTYHVWNIALNKNKRYTICMYNPRTTFGSYIGITNNLTTGVPISNTSTDQPKGGISGINKIILYYEENKWKVQVNEQVNNLSITTETTLYLEITCPNHDYSTDIKILSITEEFTETDLPIFDLSKWRVTNREGSTEQTEPTLTNTGLQLGKYKEHILTQIPLDTTKTYKIYHKDNNSYCYYGVLKKLNDGTEYINQNWRRTYNSWSITPNTEVIYLLYFDGTNWKMEYNGEAKNVASITANDNEYYLYICPINEGNILQAVVEM